MSIRRTRSVFYDGCDLADPLSDGCAVSEIDNYNSDKYYFIIIFLKMSGFFVQIINFGKIAMYKRRNIWVICIIYKVPPVFIFMIKVSCSSDFKEEARFI